MRYQKADYDRAALMVKIAVNQTGQPQRLVEVQRKVEQQLNMGLSTHKLMRRLGDRVFETDQMIGNVRRIITWVRPLEVTT